MTGWDHEDDGLAEYRRRFHPVENAPHAARQTYLLEQILRHLVHTKKEVARLNQRLDQLAPPPAQ